MRVAFAVADAVAMPVAVAAGAGKLSAAAPAGIQIHGKTAAGYRQIGIGAPVGIVADPVVQRCLGIVLYCTDAVADPLRGHLVDIRRSKRRLGSNPTNHKAA